VLVVDDEPFVVKIAQRVLERDGIEVLVAATGEEALAMMAAHPELALVILDSSLPDRHPRTAAQHAAGANRASRTAFLPGLRGCPLGP
jgi:CheY-like chemotaxis protein